MAQLIPPPPLGADPNSYVWQDWYNQISVVIDYLNELLAAVSGSAAAAQQAADDAQAAADQAQAIADLANVSAQNAQQQIEEINQPVTYNASNSSNAVFVGVGTATAEVRYNTDGTKQRRPNSGTWTNAGNWYTPTTGGIGTTHWIRFVKSFEYNGTLTGIFNTWIQLSSAAGISISSSSGEAQGAAAVSIATDSSGTTIVATGSISLYATQEN